MVAITRVRETEELYQILRLQRRYLRGYAGIAEENEKGFVSVTHSIDVLQRMHELEPSIIAKDGDQVIAYALVMSRACRNLIPLLQPMFASLDRLSFRGIPVSAYSYYAMGQICIEEQYRRTGIFDLLYQKHRELFQDSYDLVVTEISTRNSPSLRAHKRIGFVTIEVVRDPADEWEVVAWDWH